MMRDVSLKNIINHRIELDPNEVNMLSVQCKTFMGAPNLKDRNRILFVQTF